MHVCERCLRKLAGYAQNCLKWAFGRCQKCLQVGCVAWVGLSSLCPVLEHHVHTPEANAVQQGTVENWTGLSSGTTTITTPNPQLTEEYQLDRPRSWPWSNRQYSPPDEAGL